MIHPNCRALIILLAWLLVFPPEAPTQAQGDDTCPALVERAFAALDAACGDLPRGSACLAAGPASALPLSGLTPPVFSSPGDRFDVTVLDSLHLGPTDLAADAYGLARLRLQADLPADLPVLYADLLLMGEARLAPGGVRTPAQLPVTPGGALNVREGPSTRDRILGQLAGGESVMANGRLDDFSWLRITYQDRYAWVFTDLVTPAGDLARLDVVSPGEARVEYGPLQAFVLSSARADSLCAPMPESGLLIQTPPGVGEVRLRANGVDLWLDGVAFLQANVTNGLRVCGVAGVARLVAANGAQQVFPGSCVAVPLDDQLLAADGPLPPEPFDASAALGRAWDALSRPVEPAPPLTAGQLAALAVVPRAGQWTATFAPGSLTCPNAFASPVDLSASNGVYTLTFTPDGARAEQVIDRRDPPLPFTRTEPDAYTSVIDTGEGVIEARRWQVLGPDRLAGALTISFPDGCLMQAGFTLVYGAE